MTDVKDTHQRLVFRDNGRLRTVAVVTGLACAVCALFFVVGFFVPGAGPGNPNGLTETSRAVMTTIFGLAAAGMAWTCRGAMRTRLVIGADGVEVRNSSKTYLIPCSSIDGFVARGGTGVALARTDGSVVRVSAISRVSGSRLQQTLQQLNAAAGQTARPRDAHADDERPVISVHDAEQRVRASLTPLEIRWFGSTVAFAIDQARVKQSRAGRATAQGGLSYAIRRAIGAQLNVTAQALVWAAIAAWALEYAARLPLSVTVTPIVAFGALGALALWASSVEASRGSRCRRAFQRGAGTEWFELPPREGPPAPPPLWGGLMLCVTGVDLFLVGWALHSSRFTAPRATGLSFLLLGLVALSVGVSILQRARRRTV